MGLKTAPQIFSIRDILFSGLDDQFRQVHGVEYDGAEIADFAKNSLQRFVDGMCEAGLKIFSVHRSPEKKRRTDKGELVLLSGNDCRVMPIGDGVFPFSAILPIVPDRGAEWLYVEQDTPSGGMAYRTCAQRSFHDLRRTLA